MIGLRSGSVGQIPQLQINLHIWLFSVVGRAKHKALAKPIWQPSIGVSAPAEGHNALAICLVEWCHLWTIIQLLSLWTEYVLRQVLCRLSGRPLFYRAFLMFWRKSRKRCWICVTIYEPIMNSSFKVKFLGCRLCILTQRRRENDFQTDHPQIEHWSCNRSLMSVMRIYCGIVKRWNYGNMPLWKCLPSRHMESFPHFRIFILPWFHISTISQ